MRSPILTPDTAYLETASRQYHEAKARRKSGAGTGDGRSFADKIALVYGTPTVYEQFKQEVGVAPDHIAHFERWGVLLQPRQLEFAYWARLCDEPDGPREIAIGGARGPGKSFVVLAQAALDDCIRFPGLKVLYLRKTATAANEQLHDTILRVLGSYPDAVIQGNRIKFKNGSLIVIGGFKDDRQAESYQGQEYDLLIIEEATQLSENTYKLLRTSERSSKMFKGALWRPRTYVTFNPMGIGHKFFKQRFVDPERQGKPHKDRKFIFGRVTDNKFVNPEYVQNLKELVGAIRRAWLEGDWDVSAGAFFETWRYNVHVIRPIRDVSWMRRVWGSMDWGYAHWNMAYLHGEDGDGNIYTIHEWAHRKRTPAQIAPDIITGLRNLYGLNLSDLSGFKIGADAFNKTGLSEFTIEQQFSRAGLKVTRAETAPGSRIGGAQYLNQLLGDPDQHVPARWFSTKRCTRLNECIPYLEHDPNNSEDVLKVDVDAEGSGGDDPYDAARYGIYNPRASNMSSG